MFFKNYSIEEVTYLLNRLYKTKSFKGNTENADRNVVNEEYTHTQNTHTHTHTHTHKHREKHKIKHSVPFVKGGEAFNI